MDLDPAKLVGLLADPVRLRVVAALVLHPDSAAGVAERIGSDARTVVVALERLAGAGVVRRSGDGALSVDEAVFAAAARKRGATAAGAGPATDDDRLLARLVCDGRITSIPARQSKKLVLLDWLAQRFEPGRRYAEREVDELLRTAHDDYATLRRLLVDLGFLDRAEGRYWRCGGSVPSVPEGCEAGTAAAG